MEIPPGLGFQRRPLKRRAERPAMERPLSHDLIVEILTKVPVRSLIRFKSVSRDFNGIIADKHFVAAHHEQAMRRDTGYLFVGYDDGDPGPPAAVMQQFMERAGDEDREITVDSVSVSRWPNRPCKCRFSSCRGLACYINSCGCRPGNPAVVFNPITGEELALPPLPGAANSRHRRDEAVEYDLGFDPTTDAYKVLALIPSEKAFVHTLGTDAWRPVEDGYHIFLQEFRYYSAPPTPTYLNGSLYFSPSGKGRMFLFDLVTEKFRRTCDLPESLLRAIGHFGTGHACLVMGQSLALVIYDWEEYSVPVWCRIWLVEYEQPLEIVLPWKRVDIGIKGTWSGGDFLMMALGTEDWRSRSRSRRYRQAVGRPPAIFGYSIRSRAFTEFSHLPQLYQHNIVMAHHASLISPTNV